MIGIYFLSNVLNYLSSIELEGLNMTLKRIIKICISLFILIPILLLLYIFYNFTNHEAAEVLKSISFEEYKKDMKKQYTNIEKLDTYYQFGRITFDFKVKNIEEDQCYKIIKDTKDFVMGIDENEFGYTQATIRVTFKLDDNFYEFESPYWIQHSDGDLALPSTLNNYEIWYKTINGKDNEKLLFN